MPVSAQTTQTAQRPAPELSPILDQLGDSLLSPNGFILIVCLAVLAVLYTAQGFQPKNKLATARFGGQAEKSSAQRKAITQMKDRHHNAVALYLKTPADVADRRPLYLPDAQRGVAVSGAPGSGKTFSVIDPLIRAAIEQGFPIIIYDFKYPTQTSRHAAYAASRGYEVYTFAPGFPESTVINPLQFLRHDADTAMARQFAEVLSKNDRLIAGATEDRFWTAAGNLVDEGTITFAKGTEYPDILMAQAILALPELGKRIAAATNLNPWIRKSFDQLVGVKESEKTHASIIGSAADTFSKFMKPGVLGAFIGETAMPLDLEGKQLVVFGMDRERREVVGPLLAATLHMMITRNVSRSRTDPLVLAVDELPTIYLPNIVNWLNENREDGLVSILGFQNLAQLEKTYGQDLARAIIGACGTKFLFNPQEERSAHVYSDYLGQEEYAYQQRSRSSGKGGASRSISDQRQVRKLFEPSRFLKLKTGECIAINPHFEHRGESYIPLRQKISIPRSELRKATVSKDLWQKVRDRLIAGSPKRSPTAKDLEDRRQLAESLLPLPETAERPDALNELADRLEQMM